MSDQALRSKLIRLAHANPELRPQIMPLLGKTAGWSQFGLAKEGVNNALAYLWKSQEEAKKALKQMEDVSLTVHPEASKILMDVQKIHDNILKFRQNNMRLITSTFEVLTDLAD